MALEKHELRLLFQPIVDLRTYRMVGAEALLRWRHPVESVLAPDKFLRIAEEAGLMVPITRWIILRVVKLAGEWLRRLPANQKFFISINLSPTALRDPGPGGVHRLAAARDPVAALAAQVRADRSGAHQQRRRGARDAGSAACHGHPADAR